MRFSWFLFDWRVRVGCWVLFQAGWLWGGVAVRRFLTGAGVKGDGLTGSDVPSPGLQDTRIT